MSNDFLVTIGIPFYKDRKFLSEAIQSVLNQTYQNWELILLDDGSSDGSLDIAQSFKDKRIRIVSDGKNRGLPTRLNEIVELAKGEYVARMDADDIMHPERIEKQVGYLKEHPEINVLGTMAYIIDASNSIVGKTRPWSIKPRRTADIFKVGSFVHPSVMAKKEWFLANPYDVSLRRMQDLELWIRTVPNNYLYAMGEPLLFYRAIEENVTKKYHATQKYSRGFFRKVLFSQRKEYLLATILYFKTFIKSIVYSLSSLMNTTDSLVKKRYISIEDKEMAEAESWLKKALYREE